MNELKCPWRFILFAAVLLSLAALSVAGDDPKNGPLLRGLDTVHVQIKDFDPELKKEFRKAGLVEDQVKISVERRLEKAGIAVQSEEQFRKSQAKALLVIGLELVMPEAVQKVRYTFTEEGERVRRPDDDLKYVYRTDVALRQDVFLMRDSAAKGMAVTWSEGSVGYRRLNRVQADMMDQVDKFIDARKTANLP
jgi:hypothetical protein